MGDSRDHELATETPVPILLAYELAEEITRQGVPVKLLGGTAIYLTCPSVRRPPLARSYGDLDALVSESAARQLEDLLQNLRYVPEKAFNTLYGDKRLLFHRDGIDLDIFVGRFEQCHKLDFEMLDFLSGPVLPAADLLLTKLQIVEITQKDITDIMALLIDHDWDGDAKALNFQKILEVTGHDWGWYTTVSDNLGKVIRMSPSFLLAQDLRDLVIARAQRLMRAIDQQPKSLAWRLRSRIGRRIAWYAVPDEK